LGMGADTGDDQFLLQPGVGTEMGGDGDAVLAVRHLGTRSGEEHPQKRPGLLVAQRRLPDALVHALELGRAEDVQAAVLTTGDHHTTGQVLTELGREDDAALVVELGGMRAQQHRHRPLSPRQQRFPHFTPLRPTFLRPSAWSGAIRRRQQPCSREIPRIVPVERSGGRVEEKRRTGGLGGQGLSKAGRLRRHEKGPNAEASGPSDQRVSVPRDAGPSGRSSGP
ncbi:hypothetical protein ABE10_02420, partial [Bacillus toyonensis]|nr:hypothetical protein [Bacillus toyonensis]